MFLTDESTKVDGILYPSLKASLKSYNLAINNDIAKRHLEITDVFVVKVLKIENTTYTFEFIEQATIYTDDGSFVWSK